MSNREWSKEKELLFDFTQNTCVTAGAGSGKTTALVELNSRFLSNTTPIKDVALTEILAITFTEKAAGEIKLRIREMIAKHLDEKSDTLHKWIDARQALLRANISTFHSFCTRVLKENPLQAGLDAGFDIVSDLRAYELMDKSAERVILDSLYTKENGIEELIAMTGFEALKTTLKNTLNTLRSSGKDTNFLGKKLEEEYETAKKEYEKSKNEYLDLLNDYKNICEYLVEKNDSAKFLEKYIPHKHNFENKFIKPFINDEIDANTIEILSEVNKIITFSGKIKKELSDIIPPLREIVRNTLPAIIHFFLTMPLQRYTVKLMSLYEAKYSQVKRDNNFADFEDLLYLTRNLLKNKKDIRKKYKEQFRVVLVDEFQDTNELQREIVYLICESSGEESDYSNIEDLDLAKQKLFIVGDAKQSIYQFRGADVTVFKKVIADVKKKGGRELPFQENFRTVKPIIAMLNPFFAESMADSENDFEIEFRETDHLFAKRDISDEAEPFIDIILYSGKNAAEKRKTEAKAIAEKILYLCAVTEIHEKDGNKRSVSYGDIAILLRTTSSQHIYTNELKERNIPYTISGGKGFWQAQEITDIVNFLNLLYGIDEDLSLISTLRSPLCLISDNSIALIAENKKADFTEYFISEKSFDYLTQKDNEKAVWFRTKILKLKKIKDFLTPSEIIKKIIAEFDLTAVLLGTFNGKGKCANLNKLVQKAVDFENSKNGAICEFLTFIKKYSSENESEAQSEEGENSVKIMTVHKSKGLEFPIVILPDMDEKRKSNSEYNIFSSINHGIALRSRNKGQLTNTYLSDLIKKEKDNKEKAEAKRLLYVALTRAKDRLISGIPLNFDKKTNKYLLPKSGWGKEVAAFLGEEEITEFYTENHKNIDGNEQTACEMTKLYEKPSPFGDNYKFKVKFSCGYKNNLPVSVQSQKAEDIIINYDISQGVSVKKYLSITPVNMVTYALCQRKYLYDSFRGRGEGLYRISRSAPSGKPNQAKGWAVHYILEHLDFRNDIKDLKVEVEKIKNELIGSNSIWDDDNNDSLKDSIVKKEDWHWISHAVYSFLDNVPQKLGNLFNKNNTFFKEYEIYFSLFENKVYINGKMDMLIETPDGKITVLDYKYGKPDTEKILQYERQILCYLLGLKKYYTIENMAAYIIFIDDTKSSIYDIDTKKLTQFEKEIEYDCANIIEKLQEVKEDEWNMLNNQIKCNKIKCPYMSRCYF